MADLRGELFIPLCFPADREVLVLKQFDLAEEWQKNKTLNKHTASLHKNSQIASFILTWSD